MVKKFKNLDIVSITDFDKEDILYLCEIAKKFYDAEQGGRRYEYENILQRKTLASLFYEASTRTNFRFKTAMRQLGGKRDGFSGTEGTSVMKKESIRDTIAMMGANHFDAIVMRHPKDGSVQWAADVAQIPVINGGDGINEHPTQALLDMFTLYMNNDYSLDGLTIGLGGDLKHGRTIRSLTSALSNFNDITIRWSAEDELAFPEDLKEKLEQKEVKIIRDGTVEDTMKDVTAYYMTRPQIERMKNISPQKANELLEKYRINLKKIKKSNFQIMHPLPVNSEIAEIETPVFFTPNFIAYEQAENGIFMTMAILSEILENTEYMCFNGKLPVTLNKGNNRLYREINNTDKQNLDVNLRNKGIVIDHLKIGVAKNLGNILELEYDFYIACNSRTHEKSYFKTELKEITERQLKEISLSSPEPTINMIQDGNVVEKFVYLLCENDNCITRVVNEDVPPKFYNDNGEIKCRYCRRSYEMHSRKISSEEQKRFIKGLPKSVERI